MGNEFFSTQQNAFRIAAEMTPSGQYQGYVFEKWLDDLNQSEIKHECAHMYFSRELALADARTLCKAMIARLDNEH